MSGLGDFEQIVLLAVLRLGESAYGVSIRKEITVCTGKNVSPGALYTTLARLEAKGLVKSRIGEPTAERGGRAKNFVTVTKRGLGAVTAAQQAYRNLMHGSGILEAEA